MWCKKKTLVNFGWIPYLYIINVEKNTKKMKKITSIDELQAFIAERTNIYRIKKGKVFCYRVIGRNPLTMRKTDVEYTLIEKNTKEVINVTQLTLDGTDFYVGEYDDKFIGELIIAYYEWEIKTVKQIYFKEF